MSARPARIAVAPVHEDRESRTVSGTGPSDSVLVYAARAGERWACEALFRRYAHSANGLAFRLLGSRTELDDVVQESFTRAFARLHRLQAPECFGAWLSAIVLRVAKKHLYRQSVLRRLGLLSKTVELDEVIASTAPPDAKLELRRVYEAMQQMSTDVRIALTLRRVEGCSIQEICELTGVSPATVKRRVRAGLEYLQQQEGDDHEVV